MVGFSRLAVLGAVLPLTLAAVRSEPRPILSKSAELRLVKTSEEDEGTWMTEEEKFEKLISKRIGFMDITDTMVRSPFAVEPMINRISQSVTGTRGNGCSPKGPAEGCGCVPLRTKPPDPGQRAHQERQAEQPADVDEHAG